MMLEERFRLRFPSQDVVERLGADNETKEGLNEEVKESSSSEDSMPGLLKSRTRRRGSQLKSRAIDTA